MLRKKKAIKIIEKYLLPGINLPIEELRKEAYKKYPFSQFEPTKEEVISSIFKYGIRKSRIIAEKFHIDANIAYDYAAKTLVSVTFNELNQDKIIKILSNATKKVMINIDEELENIQKINWVKLISESGKETSFNCNACNKINTCKRNRPKNCTFLKELSNKIGQKRKKPEIFINQEDETELLLKFPEDVFNANISKIITTISRFSR